MDLGKETLNIVFVAHFAGSPIHGMVYGHYYLAREWVKMGHRVTIIAASWAHTRTRQPNCDKRITEEFIDGITYIWLKVPRYSPEGRFGRVVNLLAFVWQIFRGNIPIDKADIVVCSSHCPFAIHPSRVIACRMKAKLVFEVRDLWPLTLVELGGVSDSHPLIAAMQFSENYAYRNADCVISVLAAAKEYMVAHGMQPDKFHYVPNGVDFSCAEAKDCLPVEYRQHLDQLRGDGKFIIGYAGRIGLANALDSLIDAQPLLADLPVHCVFLGDGAFVDTLRKRSVALGVQDRVTFLAPVPKSQVADFLGRIDVAYIGLQRQPLFQFGVSPTKLNDYMIAKRPILYAIEGPEDIVEASDCGYSCAAQDSAEIARGIRHLYGLEKDELAAAGLKGYDWIKENRDYAVLARRFLDAVLGR